MKLEIYEPMGEGVRKDHTGRYVFDDEFDFDTDIIRLTTSTKGTKTFGNVTVYYGFEFNPRSSNKAQKEFRDALKYKISDNDVFYGEEARRFVEDGIDNMDEMKRIKDFGVVISTASTYREKTLTGLMSQICWDLMPDRIPCCNLRLLKKFCKDVTFDEQRAKEALMKTRKYADEEDADEAVRNLKQQFNKAIKSGGIFKIKIYQPVVGRIGFMDFLKFETPTHQRLYETLKEGTEVLICEDFMTSSSTINEIIRFLNAINPNNKISVFVLINQLKDY